MIWSKGLGEMQQCFIFWNTNSAPNNQEQWGKHMKTNNRIIVKTVRERERWVLKPVPEK